MELARELPLSTNTASPESQLRLLDLAAVDADLDRLAHRRRTMPEAARVAELAERLATIGDLLVAAETELGDIRRVQAKADADVEQVRIRAARDRELIDSGRVGSAKELSNLQHEVESLARRQADLEEVELEAMERVEEAERRHAALVAERDEVLADHEAAVAVRDAILAELAQAEAGCNADRAQVVAELPADLVTLYSKLREQHGGVGAARLHRGRCEGCQLELTRSDIDRIRASAPDDVVRCEECRRILVRTAESGL